MLTIFVSILNLQFESIEMIVFLSCNGGCSDFNCIHVLFFMTTSYELLYVLIIDFNNELKHRQSLLFDSIINNLKCKEDDHALLEPN